MDKGIKIGLVIGILIVMLISCLGCESNKNRERQRGQGYYSGVIRPNSSQINSIWNNMTPTKATSLYLYRSGQITLQTYNKHQIRRGEKRTWYFDKYGNEVKGLPHFKKGSILRTLHLGDSIYWELEP